MRRTLMKLNTTFLISILLLMILAVGAVSASEDISDVAIASEPSDDIISDQIDDNLETDPQEEILEEDGETKSLNDFKHDLEGMTSESDVLEINLTNNYKYDPDTDEDITRVALDGEEYKFKSIILDGKGHSVDGGGKDLIMHLGYIMSNVTVKNIIFKNFNRTEEISSGYCDFINIDARNGRFENLAFENISSTTSGYLIYLQGGYDDDSYAIENCVFKDNEVRCFLKIARYNVQVNDCNFTNNDATYFISDDQRYQDTYYRNIQLNNCIFEGNNASYFISFKAINSQINDCNFSNNDAWGYGYLTNQFGNNSKMYNCIFEDNFIGHDHSRLPVAWFGDLDGDQPTGENISVSKVTFKNNVAIPIRWDALNGNVTDCVFIGNNGTIDNRGNVYRDNGEYDFEVTVNNDTIVGAPDYVPFGPIPYIDSENVLVEVANYGQKRGNIVVLLNGTECYNKEMDSDSLSIKVDELDNIKAGDLNIVVKFVSENEEYVLYDDATSIDYFLGIIGGDRMLSPHGTLTLNISLPKQATGTLILNDGIKDNVVQYADGKATYTISGDSYSEFGYYNITLSLKDDPIFPDKAISGYIISFIYGLDAPNIVSEGETAFIFMDFPDDFEGNVEFYSLIEDNEKGELISNQSIKGVCKVQLPALTEEEHGLYIYITGVGEGPFSINYCIKNDEGIDSSIDSKSIYVGEDAVINVDCQLSNCTLTILIDENTIYGDHEEFDLNDTTLVHRISNLALGEHVVKLIVNQLREVETPWGSTRIEQVPVYSNTFLVDVSAPKLEVINSTIDNASGVFQLKLSTSDGKAINGTIISLDVNGKEYLGITDNRGIANFVLGELNVGNYTAHIALDGRLSDLSQDINLEVVSSAPISKDRIETQIAYKNMTTTAVDVATDGRVGKYFYITLKDKKGNLLKNKAVQIGFNGVVYDRVTDKNGQAKLQINLKNAGTYTFAVAFLGDDDYNGSFIVAKIVVKKQKGSLTVPAKSYKASAKTKTLTATFKNAKKHPVKGKKITFTVNGKTYSATTNAKGVATVKVSLNKKGTYKFTAKFAGNNMYAAMSKTGKLTIK